MYFNNMKEFDLMAFYSTRAKYKNFSSFHKTLPKIDN